MGSLYDSQANAKKNKEKVHRVNQNSKTKIKIPKPTQANLDKNIVKGLNKIGKGIMSKKPRKKKLKPIQLAYEKSWRKLQRNITKVVKEGYAIDFNLPSTKTKRPNKKSVEYLEALNKKVLSEAKKNINGEDLTRKQVQNRERLERAKIKRYDNKMKQGKVLTQKEQADYVSIVFDFGNLETFSRDEVEIHAAVRRLENTYNRLESQYNGSKDGSLIPYVRDWRTRTYQWLQENKDNIEGLKNTIRNAQWSNLDITMYDSDGVGIEDFLIDLEYELSDMIGRTPTMTPLPEEYQTDEYREIQFGGDVL